MSATMGVMLKPVRVATSKPAQQTYLNTILFFATSTILLGLAVIAYVLFYFSYIPQIGIERVIHLQFGDGPHPYGTATLFNTLISQQPYDITLHLSLPRSPPNLAAGNFMLSLTLLSPTYQPSFSSSLSSSPSLLSPTSTLDPSDILFSSRRPATLTYSSRLISLSDRLLSLPLYILGLRHESEDLVVPMAEDLTFPRGWKNIPSTIMLELQTAGQQQDLHVYSARIHFKAIFGGMRWIMYSHRILSFLAFVTLFWFAEVIFAVFGWVELRYLFSSNEQTRGKEEALKTESGTDMIKTEQDTDEEPDLSDTPRTFPTYGRQPPLKYVSKVKDERAEEDLVIDQTAIQPLAAAAEADDEDEEGGEDGDGRGRRLDSGLGTIFSEAGDRRRWKGKGGG